MIINRRHNESQEGSGTSLGPDGSGRFVAWDPDCNNNNNNNSSSNHMNHHNHHPASASADTTTTVSNGGNGSLLGGQVTEDASDGVVGQGLGQGQGQGLATVFSTSTGIGTATAATISPTIEYHMNGGTTNHAEMVLGVGLAGINDHLAEGLSSNSYQGHGHGGGSDSNAMEVLATCNQVV